MKPLKRSYKATSAACYIAYVVQAIVNNTSPTLFALYESDLGVSLAMLANISVINFFTQIIADLISIKLVDLFGYRKLSYAAHAMSAVGLVGLGVFPQIMPSYLGIVIATILCAIGSGLIEVIISPLIDALPHENGTASMTLLHSFYCWGSMFCVLFSTIAIHLLGENWFILPIMFAIIPAANLITFSHARFAEASEKNIRTPVRNLLFSRFFLVLIIVMICSGASEIIISQWSSFFIEKALGVPKIVGDILGPCLFAVFMGIGRIVSGKLSSKIKIEKVMLVCSLLCFFCYLGTSLLPGIFSLASCALTGLMVSLMWPATLSVASSAFVGAGTTLFSILAFSGDVGCAFGPWLAGNIADTVEKSEKFSAMATQFSLTAEQFGLRAGILLCSIFPLLMFLSMIVIIIMQKNLAKEKERRIKRSAKFR